MHRLELELLGPPRVILDGKPVKTDRHKAIGLLAYLAVEAKAHSREMLAALLWPDYPRENAFSYLRRTLWELNQMLGKEWLETDRESVALARLPGLSLDSEAFQHLLAASPTQVNPLSEAVHLYRGDFLEGLVIADTAPYEEWQVQQTEYYRREFGRALERLVASYEQNGEYESALPSAQRWLTLDRLNEAACRALMRQMAGMGDRSGAVHVYQACVQTLQSELGIAPQAETQELYRSILHGEQTEKMPASLEQPAAEAVPRLVGSLPSPPTPFIGRGYEIEQIKGLLLDPGTRLLSLTGPGGTGKTRLSIQVAGELTGAFPDGAWFIPLANVQSPQGLVLAIARGLGFSFYQADDSPLLQLLDYLREKRILLILDNFEHLVEDCRELVAEFLNASQDLKILVTSRERLNLQAEQIFRVPGMRTPELPAVVGWEDPAEQAKAYSALQLLLERARRVRPDFQLTRENLSAVTHICRLVEGSPLGIELAVAWLELLSPEEIVSEITRSLDFLETSAADMPARQRSLRAVFDTSWNLLAAEEQQAFRRLCVFPGSFSRQAAQEVSGCSIRTLLSLTNKSWLQPGDGGRYQLHEVLRQFGMECLRADSNEWQETKDRQAEYFSTFLQVQGEALRTSAQIQALQALTSEMESNIPAAFEWLASTGRIDTLIEKMLWGLFHYWSIRSRADDFIPLMKQARKAVPASADRQHTLQRSILETVETHLEMISQVFDDQPKERLEQLWGRVRNLGLEDEMGFWYFVLVISYMVNLNYEEGFQRFEEMMPKVQASQDPWVLGICYLYSSLVTDRRHLETQKKYLTDALAIFQKMGVMYEQSFALFTLGDLAVSRMDYASAIDYAQSAQRLFEKIGDAFGTFMTLNKLAGYNLYVGNIEQAWRDFEKLRHFVEKTGNRRLLAEILSLESREVARYGNLEIALEFGKRSLELAIEVGNQNDIAWHSWELGEVFRLMGDVEQAGNYFQEAYPSFEKIQEFIGLGFYHRGLGDIALLRGEWVEARHQYEKALVFHEKEQRSIRPWGLALVHARLGTLLVQLGDLTEARRHLKISLSLAEESANPQLKALALVGVARLLTATGFPAQAIEIAACVARQPTTWNEVKKQAAVIQESARQILASDEAQRAQERGEGLGMDHLSRQYLESPELHEEI
jgi:predicted ATPase/DNA-binding SARP family transcriptional activator